MDSKNHRQRVSRLHSRFVANIGDYAAWELSDITKLVKYGVTDDSLETEWRILSATYDDQFTPLQRAQKLYVGMVKGFGNRQNVALETVMSWINGGLSDEQIMQRYLPPTSEPTMEEAKKKFDSVQSGLGKCPEITTEHILENLRTGIPYNLLVCYYNLMKDYLWKT
jgi:hypothetical protein